MGCVSRLAWCLVSLSLVTRPPSTCVSAGGRPWRSSPLFVSSAASASVSGLEAAPGPPTVPFRVSRLLGGRMQATYPPYPTKPTTSTYLGMEQQPLSTTAAEPDTAGPRGRAPPAGMATAYWLRRALDPAANRSLPLARANAKQAPGLREYAEQSPANQGPGNPAAQRADAARGIIRGNLELNGRQPGSGSAQPHCGGALA